MRLRLTREADRDIFLILKATLRLFGANQVRRYAGIIEHGISMLAEDPFRASSQARDELRAGVRALHLQLAAGRQKGAAHVLYFYVRERNGVAEVVVLRVLAEQMEPKNRIARSLRRED